MRIKSKTVTQCFDNNFQNQYCKMLSERRPQIYIVEKGKLVTKDIHCQTDQSSIIQYNHTVRPTPDEYHIQAIKQYKKELDQMRRNYYELQKAYYCLLGYKWEDCQSTLTFSNFKGQNCPRVTTSSEMSEGPSTHLKKSEIEINEKMTEMMSTAQKKNNMSQSIMQLQIESISAKPVQMEQQMLKTTHNYLQSKKQKEQQMQTQLMNAFNQIKDLKFVIEQTNITCQKQIQEFRYSYEEHIRRLQQILERERKHTKMLNEVIGRLRVELQSKDNLIKSVMVTKFEDDDTIEKFVHRAQVTY